MLMTHTEISRLRVQLQTIPSQMLTPFVTEDITTTRTLTSTTLTQDTTLPSLEDSSLPTIHLTSIPRM